MESERALLISGTLLLAIAALLGFVQERYRGSPDAFARWRVVHAGGAAGGVQLIALSAVWPRLSGGAPWSVFLAWGLILAAWGFFFGPLATAMGHPRVARIVNWAGALVAFPSYLALPTLLLR